MATRDPWLIKKQCPCGNATCEVSLVNGFTTMICPVCGHKHQDSLNWDPSKLHDDPVHKILHYLPNHNINLEQK